MSLAAPRAEINSCRHCRTRIYRQPFRSGSGAHLIELCEDCHANVRGPGRWVPRSEVAALGLDPDQLPERSTDSSQPDLFGLEDL